MPPTGGYDAVQYKVGFCLFLIGVRLGAGMVEAWERGQLKVLGGEEKGCCMWVRGRDGWSVVVGIGIGNWELERLSRELLVCSRLGLVASRRLAGQAMDDRPYGLSGGRIKCKGGTPPTDPTAPVAPNRHHVLLHRKTNKLTTPAYSATSPRAAFSARAPSSLPVPSSWSTAGTS